jgi:hypothetical protein
MVGEKACEFYLPRSLNLDRRGCEGCETCGYNLSKKETEISCPLRDYLSEVRPSFSE